MNGKGGTGKTTIAALLVRELIYQKKGSVLAIDADPNSCLADALGVKDPQTIVGICDEISRSLDKIPAGITKDRFIEMRVQEAVVENGSFDLLVMGRPEGPGCYCYVNNLLRNIIDEITKSYCLVIIDNAAGMEHISRRTVGDLGRLVIVSDYSVPGLRAAKKIYMLAKELGIKMRGAGLIINKVSGALAPLKSEIMKSGLEVVGSIPYDEELVSWNISNRPIFEFESKPVTDEIKGTIANLIREEYADRESFGKV